MIVVVIHAKGHSERVPNKNLQVLGNRPLIGHAIKHALQSKADKVIIDSDDAEILDIGEQFGAIPIKRPVEWNGVNTQIATGDELAYYAAIKMPADIIVQLLPTSPFITPETINDAIDMLKNDSTIDSVFAARQEVFYTWCENKPCYYKDDKLPDSQTLEPITYETTGLYAFRPEYVIKHKRRINIKACNPILVSKLEAVDINTPEDLEFARLLWKALRKDRKSYGFDIDGTITLYDAMGDYEESIPNKKMVEKINKLYDDGHYITITTSRGHSRGTREILLKQAEKQLKEWGVKYHRLVPKTYYDKFVDDVASTPEGFLND